MPGQIYVISGPSGAGKSSVIGLLRESVTGLGYSVSHTTRKPRGDEVNGVDYHFVDRETFKRMIENEDFVEWAEVYDDFYGTSISSLRSQTELGLDVIMDVDVQGAKNMRKHFKESILICILPPSFEVLENRLKGRGTDDRKTIRKRIEKAVKEIENCVWYDYLIFNDDLQEAVEETKCIIVSERCRQSRQLPKAEKIFGIVSA
ncbi:MAG: guanylate kinase [Desulfobacteraceae bacterium]|jgi:guanylate kinase